MNGSEAAPERGDSAGIPPAQKMVSAQRPIFHNVLVRAIEVAHAVCMVTEVSGAAIGTGFLLPGRELLADLGDDLVLVTNSHVVAAEPLDSSSATTPDQVRARFELLRDDDGESVIVDGLKELWSDTELDITILQVSVPEQLDDFDPIEVSEALPSAKVPDPYVFIIGHPFGQRLSYSMRGNKLIEVGDSLLHYTAPTAQGSSGSPVFNQAFELVGVHRGGGFTTRGIHDPEERRPANEAVTMFAIRDRMAKSGLGSQPKPQRATGPSSESRRQLEF